MEIVLAQVRAEETDDGRIAITASDNRVCDYAILVAMIEKKNVVHWRSKDGILRAAAAAPSYSP